MTKIQINLHKGENKMKMIVENTSADEYAKCAECEKQSDKLAKYEKALMIIAKQRSTSEILKDIDEDNATCGCEFSEAYDLLIKDARQALADETKEVE